MNFRKPMLRHALGAALLALTTSMACAWTDKPVKIIVPAPAGGAIDVLARLVGDQLSKDLGQTFVVDNRPGGGGNIAVQALFSAPADGQTILVAASNLMLEIPHVMKQSFDGLKDLRPVNAFASVGLVLVSNPTVPAQDFAGLAAYLKATSGKYSYATHSPGTISHYAGQLFSNGAGLDLQHVPFAGAPPALAQVMGGQVTVMFDGIATSMPLIKGGKLRAYGISGSARNPALPQIPTFIELGHPELNYATWFGVVVSSKVPDALVERINQAVQKATQAPAVRDRIVGFGFDIPPPLTPAELAKSMNDDFARYGAIVKKLNITP